MRITAASCAIATARTTKRKSACVRRVYVRALQHLV